MPVAVDGVHIATPTIAMPNTRQPQDVQILPTPDLPKKLKRKVQQKMENLKAESSNAQKPDDPVWSWKSLTDSSVGRLSPVFTTDGNYFFSSLGTSVRIYSVATGQIVSTLSPPSSSSRDAAAVTSFTLNPHNPFQLITASRDGFIRTWDFVDAVLLQTIDLGQSIFLLATHKKFKDHVFVAAARQNISKGINDDVAHILRVSLAPSNATVNEPVKKSREVVSVGKTRQATGLAISSSGSWLVVTGGHKAYVAQTSELKAGFTKFVSPEKLTCLAFHPSEEYFATGDTTGNIRLWYCLGQKEAFKVAGVAKKAQTTTLHWHAHAVSSIAFTANGAYLLSGGEEAVLVIWQLHSGKKEFVPRLGAPISSVTLSKFTNGEEEYLLGLADASFAFVRSGTLKISRTIASIKLDPAISHDRPSTSTAVPLAVHTLTSSLVLPSSHPSTLQAFSPSSSKLLLELEVASSNRVSRRDEKPMEPSRVERAVISDCGEWMATVDGREGDDAFRGEVYLKMWLWDRKTGFWILNTRIDRPHGLKKITGIAFRPGAKGDEGLYLVTTGLDGNIKTWRIRSTKDKSGEVERFWVTRSTFRFRSEIPCDVSFSLDGSIFAVVLGANVALYDPDTNVVYKVLTSPECKVVLSACFIGRSGRYLAVAGTRDVVLWDLVTQNIRWHYRSLLGIDRLLSHPLQDTFVVLERESKSTPVPAISRAVIFNTSSSTPIRSFTLPFHLLNVVSHPSLQSFAADASSFALVGITDTWRVVVFGDNVCLPTDEGSTARGIISGSNISQRTLFQDIFGKSAFTESFVEPLALSVAANGARSWTGKNVSESFNAPAYLMPPLESLFDPLMNGFLTFRSPEPVESDDGHQEHDNPDEDADMEVDDNVPMVVGPQLERYIDKQEMQAFVELFMNHAIKPLTNPSTAPPPQMNGVHKPNDVALNSTVHVPVRTPVSAKINGDTPRLKTFTPSKPATQGPLTPSEPASPLTTTSKKRKKSLG